MKRNKFLNQKKAIVVDIEAEPEKYREPDSIPDEAPANDDSHDQPRAHDVPVDYNPFANLPDPASWSEGIGIVQPGIGPPIRMLRESIYIEERVNEIIPMVVSSARKIILYGLLLRIQQPNVPDAVIPAPTLSEQQRYRPRAQDDYWIEGDMRDILTNLTGTTSKTNVYIALRELCAIAEPISGTGLFNG